ncbi:3D domain-containing protein [Paenibacillus alvei]|uniref:LysM peptidoglycan-binding domain-containing protein n=1 Tax=Paenibacillus alvei TaxID=44250 RepID=A0AAP7A5I6_PAEAL|nr:3D domain-containing protein [Paenibacillus alvei]MBG9736564.1 hypothetical protein [Paenibacillus alvei]MBG9743882.1 hypothetical protein [Paenibacillus alvei]MCY9578657.1 3D domain-containing protein [Paenibacillus alvei]MCY9584014.1 3D domain-containing protein [Paenibacillus alvei]NEZ42143.1 LysM peptidoglycan-binding domain-containing protein [Paenibacillus alvei]
MRKRITVTITAALLGLASILQILPVQAEPYTVTEGETFYSIAKKYNMSVESVLSANPTINPKNLYGGLSIELPGPVVQKSVLEGMPVGNALGGANNNGQAVKTASASNNEKAVQQAAPKNVVQMSSGRTATYKKTLNMRATAYTAHPSENGKWGAVDALGNALKLGTVAVDPKVIPLGTKLYITGYDFKHLPTGGMVAVATDTGGAIKGKKVDIFVPVSKQTGNTFGVQDVKVYVLK